MKYIGSKRTIAKHIMPIILAERKVGQLYIEPFVGGGNSFVWADNPRLGTDIDKYPIALLSAIRDGWIPPHHVSYEQYYSVKKTPTDYLDAYVAFVGFECSFGGAWWNGYVKSEHNYGRSRAKESSNTLLKQAAKLQGAQFMTSPYDKLTIPDGSLVYCDPPYVGTRQYRHQRFDHHKFWDWVRRLSVNNTVFVSESVAPDDFTYVWEQEAKIHLKLTKSNERQRRTERLWICKK